MDNAPRRSPVTADPEYRESLMILYRFHAAFWAIYAIALCFLVYGSTMLRYADILRPVVLVLTVVVTIAMIVRTFIPGRPLWTQWALPVLGGTATATFVLNMFGADLAGGFTVARLGVSLLIVVPALLASTTWLGERAVLPS